MSKTYRNIWDAIVGCKLRASSRKVEEIKHHPTVVPDNSKIYEIKRIGGIPSDVEIKKCSKKKDVPKNLKKLKIHSNKKDKLQGNSIYCECKSSKMGITTLSSSHKGHVGAFKSKKAALAILIKKFTQTKEIKLTGTIQMREVKEKVSK